jgi:hypothetical protein
VRCSFIRIIPVLAKVFPQTGQKASDARLGISLPKTSDALT